MLVPFFKHKTRGAEHRFWKDLSSGRDTTAFLLNYWTLMQADLTILNPAREAYTLNFVCENKENFCALFKIFLKLSTALFPDN